MNTALARLTALAAGFAATATLMAGCASLPARHLVDVAPVDAPAPTPAPTVPAPLTVPTLAPLPAKPPCEGPVVAVVGDAPLDCDVTPPQRLDVWYPGSDGIESAYYQAECDDAGGTLAWDVEHDQFVCRGVDY